MAPDARRPDGIVVDPNVFRGGVNVENRAAAPGIDTAIFQG